MVSPGLFDYMVTACDRKYQLPGWPHTNTGPRGLAPRVFLQGNGLTHDPHMEAWLSGR